MASLFDRDVKTIGKHVKNAIEEELEGISGAVLEVIKDFKKGSLFYV